MVRFISVYVEECYIITIQWVYRAMKNVVNSQSFQENFNSNRPDRPTIG
jgi:hypothetical protein